MAVDYHINLAKGMTSSEEDRGRFYNGMLIYLVTCAVLMVGVAYLSSVNLKRYVDNNRHLKQLLSSASADSGLNVNAFKNPERIYSELDLYSGKITGLKKVLSHRVQLLPVVHNLFVDLPEGVTLQSLSANKSNLSFGLIMPPSSEQAGDPVRDLRSSWETNKELMRRVATIRPVTGERRMIGSKSVFYVQFECILNK